MVPEARFATRKEDRDRELVDDLLNDMIGPGHLTLSTDGMSDRIASAAAQLGTGPIGRTAGTGVPTTIRPSRTNRTTCSATA